jgi:F-type H+-transporting ATPase subunit c
VHLFKRCITYASLKLTKKRRKKMEVAAAKLIGAGLAAIALGGAGVGIGTIFGNYLSAAIRNPSAAQKQFPTLLLGFALAEATGLFALVIALLILFAF